MSFKKECIVPSLVEINPVVLEEIFNFVKVFSLFRNYLPLEKGETFHLNKYESSLPKYLVEIGPVVLEKRILKISMYFNYFVIISP